MRRHIAIVLLLISGFLPFAASAQQTTPNADQAPVQAQPELMPQRAEQGQAQTQDTPVQPERTPQQSDQARNRDRQRAEDTRVNRDWTARQRGEDRLDMDRTRGRQMGRMMDDQEHRTSGRNWRRDDDEMDRYEMGPRGQGRYGYYEPRPRARVKTCIEYENGDEFCSYRD